VDILILSARHGLIRPTRKIEFYDQRMTPEIAARQAARNRALLRRVLQTGRYAAVFINAGQAYLAALQPAEAWLCNGVALRLAEGGIGRKLQRMKQWLTRLDESSV
jgi:hypothetical protein